LFFDEFGKNVELIKTYIFLVEGAHVGGLLQGGEKKSGSSSVTEH